MLGFKLIHRMIFVELLKVFTLTLVALTSLLLLAGLVTEASQHGMSPGQILSVIPLLLPNMLPYTLPTTTLFATCVVYGRLAADSEILAIKAAGVHVAHVVWPAVLLGLGASTATAALYYETIPATHHQLRTQVFNDIESYLYGILRKEGRLQHAKINYVIYVKQVDGDILRDAQFMRPEKNGTFDIIARAKEAKLRVDLDKRLLWVDMRNCEIVGATDDRVRVVQDKSWPVELPPDFASPTKMRPTDMTWEELDQHRAEMLKVAEKVLNDIQEAQAVLNHSGGADPERAEHLRNLQNTHRLWTNMVTAIDVEKHMRPAIALGCLCFVLVGCPVGIWFSKSDYLSAFITCFLPIIVIYYPLLLSSINASKGLKLTPLVIWSANGVMLLVAVPLFARLARH